MHFRDFPSINFISVFTVIDLCIKVLESFHGLWEYWGGGEINSKKSHCKHKHVYL